MKSFYTIFMMMLVALNAGAQTIFWIEEFSRGCSMKGLAGGTYILQLVDRKKIIFATPVVKE